MTAESRLTADLRALIEEKGREVAEALARLRRITRDW
jgi:hypothetical protein